MAAIGASDIDQFVQTVVTVAAGATVRLIAANPRRECLALMGTGPSDVALGYNEAPADGSLVLGAAPAANGRGDALYMEGDSRGKIHRGSIYGKNLGAVATTVAVVEG